MKTKSNLFVIIKKKKKNCTSIYVCNAFDHVAHRRLRTSIDDDVGMTRQLPHLIAVTTVDVAIEQIQGVSNMYIVPQRRLKWRNSRRRVK